MGMLNMIISPEYIVDEIGNRTKVLLNYDSFVEMLEIIEDFEDSKLIEQTKDEEVISFSDYKL
jgi:hypothetical protein